MLSGVCDLVQRCVCVTACVANAAASWMAGPGDSLWLGLPVIPGHVMLWGD